MVPTLTEIEDALEARGMTPRGAFHCEGSDSVPPLGDGRKAASLVLAGNAGPAMWRAFARDRAADARLAGDDHPLDAWSRLVLGEIAAKFGAAAFLPNDGPPHHPFQQWAMRAERLHISPINILIHPAYGLWHGYRGALAFAERLDLPPPGDDAGARPSPCESCAGEPCLSTCPVGAFSRGGYDVQACIAHIESAAGSDCREQGCRARRACPVGQEFIYAPEQAEFHTAAFVRAYKRG